MIKDTYKDLKLYTFSESLKETYGSKKTKGLIFGNFGALNYGDEAILAGQLEELNKVKNISVKVISRFPEIVKNVHNVEGVPLLNIFAIISEIVQSNFIIFGGGGLFCKNTSGVRGILFQLYYLIFFLALPLILNKKVYAFGIGFYSNTDSIITSLAIPLLRNITKITVRDEQSYEFLKSKNIDIEFCKDNSFLLSLYSKEESKKLSFINNAYNPTKKNIGIALKQPSKKFEEKLTQAVIDFIIENKNNTEFWFYSLDTHPFYPSDRTIHEEIIKDIQFKDKSIRCHLIPEKLIPKELFSSFQKMDFFVAMRLHSMIFAYRQNISFAGINYDEKCSSFMKTIGGDAVELQDISSSFLNKVYKQNNK